MSEDKIKSFMKDKFSSMEKGIEDNIHGVYKIGDMIKDVWTKFNNKNKKS